MSLKVLTLNMHGYHPMGERKRWFEDRHGRIRPAGEYPGGESLFYFTIDELDRGHRNRLNQLASDIATMQPDVICLQEVAAGRPGLPLDESLFHREFPVNYFEANSADRLAKSVNRILSPHPEYKVHLACRGNVGWVTNPGTFAHERIVTFDGTTKKIVHDFHSNPYSQGLLVEGFALLVRDPYYVVRSELIDPTTNSLGHRVNVQGATIKCRDTPSSFDLLNVHLGHKISHFEQALALLDWLKLRDRSLSERQYRGGLIAGDFNAKLYRPTRNEGEISMLPWEIARPGEFDFRSTTRSSDIYPELIHRLQKLNDHPTYKPWATIHGDEAGRRIREAVDRYFRIAARFENEYPAFVESLELADHERKTVALESVPSSGVIPRERIDYIFAPRKWQVRRASWVYPENGFTASSGTSDHPAFFVEYENP